MMGLYKLYFHKVYCESSRIQFVPKPSYCAGPQRIGRMSRRRCRSLGRIFSTRLTISDADIVKASANSRMVDKDGLNLARSRRLIYFGWYPLSKPNCSCVKPRRSEFHQHCSKGAFFSGIRDILVRESCHRQPSYSAWSAYCSTKYTIHMLWVDSWRLRTGFTQRECSIRWKFLRERGPRILFLLPTGMKEA